MLPTQQSPPEIQQTHNGNMNYANNGFGPVNGVHSLCSSGQNSPMSTVSSYSAGYQHPAGYPHSAYPYSVGSATPQSTSSWQDNPVYMPQPQQQPPQQQQIHHPVQKTDMEQVHYVEPEYWANVAYYELNSRVGESFRCNVNSYSLIIDGFTHPSDNTTNRFCLGRLSNINRNSTVSFKDRTNANLRRQST